MPIATALGLLAALGLIGANAFFVAAEFGLVAADRTRIEQQAASGRKAAQRSLDLIRHLSFHLSGAQLGITISSLALGFIAERTVGDAIEPAVAAVVGERNAGGVTIALALFLVTVVQMLLGELIPKNLVIARPEATALRLATPIQVYGVIAAPLIRLGDRLGRFVTARLGVKVADEIHAVADLDDLEYLVDASVERGTLSRTDATLLVRGIRFADKTAAEVLIPRTDVVALDADATVADMVTTAGDTGLSRFPIMAGDLDRIIGVVHVKAALAVPPARRSEVTLRRIATEILAVPESRDLAALLGDLRARRAQLAVVVDEHGGTAGVVTFEDVIEEIVGEIEDEYDDDAELTVIEGEGVYLLPGGLHADGVEEITGLELPEGDYDTLAGFVLLHLQRVPQVGEVLRHDGWRFEVVEMDRQRIETVRVREPYAAVQERVRARSRGERQARAVAVDR